MLVGNLVEAHTPISFITYVIGINRTAKNRKIVIPHHPLQLISNTREENCRRLISVSFYNSNFSSSEPILQAICFNLNQNFSSLFYDSISGLCEEVEQRVHMLSF